ncbi:ABC-F family ATP-binding cassette domain-containing protein [Candidatus Sumerlaeota bacterium]|nr:ABC-F family ATP-binding cassette domain-containing protein [Candidatus Sumerlaeota bacterium]
MSVSLNEVTCILGGKTILEKVSFRLGEGEKAALVGENGSGKSTILKIMNGIISVDYGEVSKPKNITIGYLPQEDVVDTSHTLKEELLNVFDDLISAETELRELERQMAEVSPDSKEFERISHRYDFLQHEMIRRGGYSIESDVGRITAGLGFSTADLRKPCREFSGGWQMRILLAKLLLRNPNVLLLDEPTNHLDLESILWLEDWIRNSPSSVLMVSHERAFMDNLVGRIFEIHRGALSVYKGNYSSYLIQREDRYEQMRRAWENQQQMINQMRRFIDKNRADKYRAGQVQSRIKQLEKMEELPLPPSHKAIRFSFPQPDRGNREVVELEHCEKSYGDKKVLKRFDLTIYRDERVALVGLNGVGKSTLMRLLSGVERPTHGKRRMGTQISPAFFSQYQHDDLNPDKTVLDSMYDRAPLDVSANVRDLLGAFLFSGDDVNKKVSVLSGGEKTRLRLARMLYCKANLLLMDEPTNHLDVASRATLEKALQQYAGTLVFVSHDRVFMDRLANKVLEIHNGTIRHYPGNFTDYMRAKERGIADGVIDSAPFLVSDGKIMFSGSLSSPVIEETGNKSRQAKKTKEEKRLEARRRNELSRKKTPLQKEIKFLEGAIHKSESRIEEIEILLTKPDVYSDPGKCSELVNERKASQKQMEQDMALWEKKNKELEQALNDFGC